MQRIQVQPFFTGQVLVAHRNHMGQSLGCRLEHGIVRVQVRLLRHIGDANALLTVQRTVVRMCQTAQNFEQ